MTSDSLHLILTPDEWRAWLASLGDLPDGPALLSLCPPGTPPADAYALSAYAEALQSAEVDGELWETYGDLELEGAASNAEAWQEIKHFYRERGFVLLEVRGTGADEVAGAEPEEWIFAPEVLALLQLPAYLTQAGRA